MLSLERLNELVEYATDPAGAGFYRRFYGMTADAPARSISSLEEWLALPVLQKDALNAETLSRRSYIPLSSLDHLRASSGTSGKPPLFSPRTHVRNMEYRLAFHDFKRPFLAFTVPMMPHWHSHFQESHGGTSQVISYDPKCPRASVALAAAAGADAFSVFVYHVAALGEEMKRAGINRNIKLAEVTGEICTRAQYEYLRETFPNATIVQSYNSSEVEDAHIGIPCKAMDGSEPLAVYHPKETHYLELLDPDTGSIIEPTAGAEGDLLISAFPGKPTSFPLVRYRIGDTARIVSSKCPHGGFAFTVLGRTDLDFIKVPGGVLRADEIARVLKGMSERLSDRFELHAYEERTDTGVRIAPVLMVDAKEGVDLAQLADEISRTLRISPELTYAGGVELGRFAALRCERLQLSNATKAKRIVRHAA